MQHTDWRAIYLLLVTILAVVTIPAHWIGLRGPWPQAPTPPNRAYANHDAISCSPAFLALVVALSLGAFTAFARVFNLVPLLLERGFSPSLAALVEFRGISANISKHL
ncbi:hypothetical protein [Nocardia sp. NPDC050412]|uniref:hypothetical protein n=1 Tax=unclassified Nocardia TaxID=2637762 RepID=UPI0037AB1553